MTPIAILRELQDVAPHLLTQHDLYLLAEDDRLAKTTRRAPWVARACWTGVAAVAVVLLGMGVWYGR